MKVTISVPAIVFDNISDVVVTAPVVLDGWSYTDLQIGPYLDFELADAGALGGEIRAVAKDGQAELLVDYWVPADFPAELLECLVKETLVQFDDGIGEGGFDVVVGDKKLRLVAVTDSQAKLETVDDGRLVPIPSAIAITARNGNVSRLAAEVQTKTGDVDAMHQGHTGLHYAILYGHYEAAVLLLNAGADPNKLTIDQDAPLMLCALSNSLTDEQSCKLARMLIDLGADRNKTSSTGDTAKSYALIRKKHRTAEIL